jgi:hypothetical protein
VFQPDCRLVAVTLPQGGLNDKKNLVVKWAFLLCMAIKKNGIEIVAEIFKDLVLYLP